MNRRGGALGDDARQVVRQPVVVPEDLPRALRLVLEDEPHAAVQVAGHLEPLAHEGRVEGRAGEDAGIGVEADRRAGAARRLQLAEGGDRLAAAEGLLPEEAVAPGGGDEFLRQRVHDARADSVQPPRRAIGSVLELPAGVQRGEDDLESARAARRVPVDGHPAAVVGDGDGGAARVQRHLHVRGMAVHRFVDGVVENLPDEVMKARRADAPDVHPGPLAHRLEALENRDVPGRV